CPPGASKIPTPEGDRIKPRARLQARGSPTGMEFTMHKIRVLLVDDSVVLRHVFGDLLSDEPGLEGVGTGCHGRIAVDQAARTNPDVVVLDLEMPGLDGLQTLAALRQSHPSLPVILFSQHTQRGAAIPLDALGQGASDCVAKPE